MQWGGEIPSIRIASQINFDRYKIRWVGEINGLNTAVNANRQWRVFQKGGGGLTCSGGLRSTSAHWQHLKPTYNTHTDTFISVHRAPPDVAAVFGYLVSISVLVLFPLGPPTNTHTHTLWHTYMHLLPLLMYAYKAIAIAIWCANKSQSQTQLQVHCCSAALVGPDPLLGSEMQFLPAVRLIACLELLATLFDAFCHKPNSAEAHFRCHN